jgi:hypothetical protein
VTTIPTGYEIPHLRDAANAYLDRYGHARTQDAAAAFDTRTHLYLIDTIGAATVRTLWSTPYGADDDDALIDELDGLLHSGIHELPTADNTVDMLVMARMTLTAPSGQTTAGLEILVVDGNAQALQVTWDCTDQAPEFIFDPHRHSQRIQTAILARLLALRLVLEPVYGEPARTPDPADTPPPASTPTRRSTALLTELIAAATGETYVPEEACVRAVTEPDTMRTFLLSAGELAAVNALSDLYHDAFTVLADGFPDNADDIHTAVTGWRDLDARRDTLHATIYDLGVRLEVLEPPPAPAPHHLA